MKLAITVTIVIEARDGYEHNTLMRLLCRAIDASARDINTGLPMGVAMYQGTNAITAVPIIEKEKSE